MKKYLPSKKSTYIIITLSVVAVLLVLTFKFLFGSQKISAENEQASQQLETGQDSITDNLLTKSSAGDGIPDWEKALWGLDPKKTTAPDGTPDAAYIKNKQEELKTAAGTSTDQNTASDENLNETDKFARQFFATFVAMQQSGQVDADTINTLSSSLGQNIVDQTLPDKYSDSDITTTSGGKTNDQKYYTKVQDLFNSYKDTNIGEEINIVASVIGDDSVTLDQKTQAEAELDSIGDTYQDFADKLMALSVPSDLTDYHLQIANSSYNTGLSVKNLSKAIDDPIVGLSGLSQYQTYSSSLISSINDLKTYVSNDSASNSTSSNAIINQ